MTRVGWIGLGKLGLPCALVLANHGHVVHGYDINPDIVKFLIDSPTGNYIEPGIRELTLSNLNIHSSTQSVVNNSDIVFIAVQTPHAPQYGGEFPVPEELRDFEYGYLIQAVRDVVIAAASQTRTITIVIVSTVLPGTTERLLRPLIRNSNINLVYSPQFIAMGTVIWDFMHPEFLLIGADNSEYADAVIKVFSKIYKGHVPLHITSLSSAEMIKVAYNTFISMKIVWANHIAILCEGTGANVDEVMTVLADSKRRLISNAYMKPGMGDGGACHPRDLIALASLERRLDAPGFFAGLAALRDTQTEILANLIIKWVEQTRFPIVILGKSYKPNTKLIDGSPALLLASILREKNYNSIIWDPSFDDTPNNLFTAPKIYVIAVTHDEFQNQRFPKNSVIIDPWGWIPNQPDIIMVTPGR